MKCGWLEIFKERDRERDLRPLQMHRQKQSIDPFDYIPIFQKNECQKSVVECRNKNRLVSYTRFKQKTSKTMLSWRENKFAHYSSHITTFSVQKDTSAKQNSKKRRRPVNQVLLFW